MGLPKASLINAYNEAKVTVVRLYHHIYLDPTSRPVVVTLARTKFGDATCVLVVRWLPSRKRGTRASV